MESFKKFFKISQVDRGEVWLDAAYEATYEKRNSIIGTKYTEVTSKSLDQLVILVTTKKKVRRKRPDLFREETAQVPQVPAQNPSRRSV